MGRLLNYHSLISKLNGNDAKRSVDERDDEFNRLLEKKNAIVRSKIPSYAEIPQLYEKSPQPDSLAHRVRMEARHMYLQEKTKEVSETPDVGKVLESLRARCNPKQRHIEAVDYLAFKSIGQEQSPRLAKFFTPAVFLKFSHDEYGCIPVQLFFTYLIRQLNVLSVRLQLTYYDSLGFGYLREKDLENYVFELLPTLSQLKALQEAFYPFYVFTAVRRFFFFLDVRRRGGVRVCDLLLSRVFVDFFEMRNEVVDERELASNWFSVQSALRIYGAYLELDKDQNGTLSPEELGNYSSAVLTETFLHRVFQEFQTYDGEMDYRTFLDFVLAMENPNTVASMAYFWRVLDINHNGKIDAFVIRYFYQGIKKVLENRDFDTVADDDVVDEIFDMARPKNLNYITFEDLVASGQGSRIVSVLTDAHAFWEYDNRESLLQEGNDDQTN